MELQHRLARLERAQRLNRRLLAARAAAPLAWALLPARAADAPAAAADAAQAVGVRNTAGTLVAAVRATADGSSLTLCDAAGKPKLLLAVTADGPALYMLDGNESAANKGVRLAMSVSEKSGPSVGLFNATNTQPAASMRLKSDGQMGQFVATDGNEQRFAFPRPAAEGDADKGTGRGKGATPALPAGGKKDASGN